MTPANRKPAGAQRTLGSLNTLGPIEDTKRLCKISEYGSVSRIKKTQTDLCLHEDMFPSFKSEENGRQHHFGEEDRPVLLSPNPESKPLNRKSLKNLTSFPCSKRPRTDQSNDSVMTAKVDDQDAKKIGYDHMRCISDEKCRIAKQKRASVVRNQDSKRIDKKSFKARVKTKFDPFTSKARFISSDSTLGGIDAIGIYGLKSDLHDVTEHLEELSLDELLDGSYKHPNPCPEKGEKASNGNENVLLSVRKACSILPLHGVADNGGNRKTLTSIQNPNLCSANMLEKDEKDKCTEELCSKDACQMSSSTLYQPKDILERLAIPPVLDLEALILNLNPAMDKKAFSSSRLPPFPWSFSHGGACKPGVDSCKFSLPRSAGQSKWVRIGSSSTSTGGGKSCFSGLEVKALDPNDDFVNQRKMDELLQDVKSLTESIIPQLDGPQQTSNSHVLDKINLIKGSVAFGSLNSRKLELLNGHVGTSDNHEDDDSKDYLFPQKSHPEVGLRCVRSELNSMDSAKSDSPFKGNVVGQKEHPERITDDRSQSCCSYPSKSSTGGCGQSLWHLPVPEISNPGHSSQVLTAAAILCEIASCSIATWAQNDSCVKMKWPPSQNSIRDRKSTFSVEKTERSFLAWRHYDTFKRTVLPSAKHRLMVENKTDFAHTNGREPVKWSMSGELDGASPRKLERDHVRINPRPLHGNSMRTSGLMQSPIRVEKVYDNHQKLGKETLKTSNVGFGESYIKDWSRGRSKRV